MDLRTTPYRYTQVSVGKSRDEIDGMLAKYDASQNRWTNQSDGSFILEFARPDDVGHLTLYQVSVAVLTNDQTGRRQAARFLHWFVKSKLEAVALGIISDFETEWLPYQMIHSPTGPKTVAQAVLPQLKAGGTNIDPFRPALPSGESHE